MVDAVAFDVNDINKYALDLFGWVFERALSGGNMHFFLKCVIGVNEKNNYIYLNKCKHYKENVFLHLFSFNKS